MPSIKSRLARGSLWISGGRGVTTLLNTLTTIVLARILVPGDFGLVALAASMVAIISAVTNLSLASALIHHKDPSDDHYHTAWTLGFARGLVLALGFCAAAGPMVALYREPRLDEVMYALSLVLLLSGLSNPRLMMLQKKLVFWQSFAMSVAETVVTMLVSIGIALVYRSYWALVLGTIAGQLASLICSYALFPYRPRPRLRHVRELWSFSVWLSLQQMVNVANYRVDHLLVGGILGRPALGFYSVGNNLAVAPTREATRPLTQTLFPAFAMVAEDPGRLRAAYQKAQAFVTAVTLPLGVGVALIAEPLVRLAMGDSWAPAALVIQVLAAVFAVQTLGTLVQPLAMATGATRLLFVRSLQTLCLRLPLVLAGMFLAGLEGLLIARACSGTLGIAINMRIVSRLIDLPLKTQLAANTRSLISVTLMAGGVIALQSLLPPGSGALDQAVTIIASIFAGALIYCGASALLWKFMGKPDGPETEAIAVFQKMLTRFRRMDQVARASQEANGGRN